MEQAILEQNPHWSGQARQQQFVRLHDEQAIVDLRLDEIQVITGIRRCGKSTLLKRLIDYLSEHHEATTILYVNFDDPIYIEVCQNPSALRDVLTTAEKLTGKTIEFLFLDEIQQMDAWEKYVKSVYDSQRFKKIVVTGSNADLLNSDYASLLSGRYIETRVFPLSFRERLIHAEISDYLQLVQNKATALAIVDDMLTIGSFPRITLLEDSGQRRRLLKSYYETILLKDCVSNHNVRDTKTLQSLAHYLISNNSTLYSYNSLSKAVGSNENTVKQFIQIFQDAYFLKELYHFSYSLKTQSRANKKTYCIDNGLITATSFKFVDNSARLFENLVFTEFAKSFMQSIYFYQDKNECDFIINHEMDKLAVQVCYQLTPANRQREINGLKAAMQQYDITRGVIITYDQEESLSDEVVGAQCNVIPFWKYFSYF